MNASEIERCAVLLRSVVTLLQQRDSREATFDVDCDGFSHNQIQQVYSGSEGIKLSKHQLLAHSQIEKWLHSAEKRLACGERVMRKGKKKHGMPQTQIEDD